MKSVSLSKKQAVPFLPTTVQDVFTESARFITPHVKCTIQPLSKKFVIENGRVEFGSSEIVVSVGNERFSYLGS